LRLGDQAVEIRCAAATERAAATAEGSAAAERAAGTLATGTRAAGWFIVAAVIALVATVTPGTLGGFLVVVSTR
jgi:hypothetical protein